MYDCDGNILVVYNESCYLQLFICWGYSINTPIWLIVPFVIIENSVNTTAINMHGVTVLMLYQHSDGIVWSSVALRPVWHHYKSNISLAQNE